MSTELEAAKQNLMEMLDEADAAVLQNWQELLPTVEKGGPGSGHFGHSGRPGKVGGSSAGSGVVDDSWVKYVDSLDDLKEGVFYKNTKSKAYVITLDKEIADVYGSKFRDHPDILYYTNAPEKFGIAKEDQKLYSSAEADDYYWLYDMKKKSLDAGTIMVRSSRASVDITIGGSNFDVSQLRKLQRLYDEGLIDNSYGANKFVISVQGYGGIHTDFATFLDAKYVLDAPPNSGTKKILKEFEEKQLPIDDKSIRNLITIRQQLFYDSSDSLAEQLFTGDISIGQWEESMKQLIRGVHTSTAAIGKGGWDNMSWSDWGRLGTPLREQYRYLHGFAETISNKRDTISLQAIQARARLYGNASGYSATLMQAGADIEAQLPWMPKDGSTECLINCRCVWVLEIIDTLDDGSKLVQATWRIRPAEHCQDCIDRNNHVEIITVGKDVEVPGMIGGF